MEASLMATKAVAEKSTYDFAMENFDIAADMLGLDSDMRNMIKYPERVLAVVLPVRMDNGKILRFQGYRVQHSRARGPAKGGIRYPQGISGRRLQRSSIGKLEGNGG